MRAGTESTLIWKIFYELLSLKLFSFQTHFFAILHFCKGRYCQKIKSEKQGLAYMYLIGTRNWQTIVPDIQGGPLSCLISHYSKSEHLSTVLHSKNIYQKGKTFQYFKCDILYYTFDFSSKIWYSLCTWRFWLISNFFN